MSMQSAGISLVGSDSSLSAGPEARLRWYARSLLGSDAPPEEQAIETARSRLTAMLAYHRPRFESARKRSVGEEELLESLSRGEFALGRREGYDLVVDVILAAFLEAGINEAAQAFDRRFAEQIKAWAAKYAPDDPELADDLKTDLLLPREKSGPRISTYQGHGPMDGWLKQVVISQAERRRRARGRVLELHESDFVCRLDPGEEYARKECTEKLAPAIAGMFEPLDQAHRTVLQMSIVDGVEQKKIAALFGVSDYKITRMKQAAIRKVTKAFYACAERVVKMNQQAVRECLELIMARFGPRAD